MAGLFSRMAAPFATRASAGVPSYGMIPPLGSVASASGMLVSQATAMTVSAVYACVTLIARDVARCVPSLYESQDDGSRLVVKDHPIARILKRPNRIQTWFEFIRDLMLAYLLRGNGYAAVLRDHRGNVSELILINPDAVMVLEASDGSIFYNVNRIGLFQIAVLQQFPVAIAAEDVFHLRGPSFNMLIGASTIGLARDSVGLAIGLSQQQSRWVANGAKPSVVLETDRQLSDAAFKRMKASWEDVKSGIQNVGRTAILEEGVKAHQLQLTSVDLQMIDQLNLSVQDICRFFNVPPRKIGVPDTSRGSTIIQDDQAYVNGTVSPNLDLLEAKFERDFGLYNDGMELDLDESGLLRADPMTRYNLGRIGILSGMLKPNEWRRGERLPPVPGGDEVRAPVNTAALGSDLTGTASDDAGRPPANQAQAQTGNAQDEAPGA